MAAKRLNRELKSIQSEPPDNDIILFPKNESDLLRWCAFIKGPPDTPYFNAYFELDIQIPPNYPLQSPSIHFVTPIFHPNVHFKTGEICLDILKNAWSAAFTLQSVCRSIVALLSSPEPDSPLNCDAGNLLRLGDYRGFRSLARMYALLRGLPHPRSGVGLR